MYDIICNVLKVRLDQLVQPIEPLIGAWSSFKSTQ